MKPYIKRIEESEFKKINLPILFHNEQTDRYFGIVGRESCKYKFSWRSSVTTPEFNMINSEIYSLGIDQSFAVIDFAINSVKLRMNLSYNFFTVKIYKDCILVVTELEILKISKQTYKILSEYGLPDIFESIQEKNADRLLVKCMNGDELVIN